MPASVTLPAHHCVNPKAKPVQSQVVETIDHIHETIACKTIATTCAYCGVGCGVLAQVHADKTVTVAGDPNHPANRGKLCSKGKALGDSLAFDRRLTTPSIDGMPASYADALDHVARQFAHYRQTFGANSVMLYVSGQLLTEDYYVANKFAKGFLGTNNIDSNSRLCMSSAVAGYKRAFGSDTVPCSYQDIEDSEMFVIIGSNMAWCHPILFGRLKQAKLDKPDKKIVVIDPRQTDSCQIADLHLPIRGGTDTHLLNGLLHFLHAGNHGDADYLRHCEGVGEAVDASQAFDLNTVASVCGVDIEDLTQFYQWFADHDKVVSFYSMGVNQSSSGTDKVNGIINAHLYTGKMGYAGAGAFSITGQPNAMGGREVGALANLLASHFDLKNAQHRQLVAEFWHAPVPISADDGIKSADVADAILDGKIKAIWIMATNPVVSLPEADKFAQALAQCELVVVSECSKDSDTLQYADVVLPAQGWSEKSGTVTNSERCISRQRRLLPPIADPSQPQTCVKPDWWLISQVAQKMGFAGFEYTHEQQIFTEHARLSGFANASGAAIALEDSKIGDSKIEDSKSGDDANGLSDFQKANHQFAPRSFDISHLATLSKAQYDAMTPLQWGQTHYFGHEQLQQGQVYTPSKKARLIAIRPRLPQSLISSEYPLIMNTGRLRDQWHTMTRTGMASQLNQHLPEPFVAMHPDDAKQRDTNDSDFVQVTSQHGSLLVRAKLSSRQRMGDVFVPMHWNDHFAHNARVGKLITAHVDPHSQQPESKYTPVSLTKVAMTAFAKLMICHQADEAVLDSLQARQDQQQTNQVIDSKLPIKLPIKANYWVRNRQTHSSDYMLATKSLVTQSLISKSLTSKSPSNKQDPTDIAPKQQFDWLSLDNWQSVLLTWLQHALTIGEDELDTLSVLSYQDVNQQDVRLAIIQDTAKPPTQPFAQPTITESSAKLLAVLFVHVDEDKLPSHGWLDSLFSEALTPLNRKWLLAGKPATGYVDVGRIVCSCMTVGENTIIDTIKAQGCTTAFDVGKHCNAGTNCGSCISDINQLIEHVKTEPA